MTFTLTNLLAGILKMEMTLLTIFECEGIVLTCIGFEACAVFCYCL